MSELLVSVRSAEEALVALEGGAAIIDIKEPSRGSLGRADDDVISEIARVVANRCPVSAALGEWRDENFTIPRAGLTYVKWGLAGCQRNRSWATSFKIECPQRVFVAYADWECAAAPSIEEVFEVAAQRGGVMLIDTHCKDANNVIRKTRPTLLDWLPVNSILSLCDRARAAKLKIALAGSLGVAEITTLLPARPDWFAVRGAVCDDADRNAGVQLERVRNLVTLLKSAG
jgi:uncharacterized protein (UPF0264 family)